MAKGDVEERVKQALALVRLPGYERRRAHELSGGQMQRVALARALVNRPRVLLLDEPLSALDLKIRLEMEEELRRVHRETGATFVYVTHDQREALALSDRIVVFDEGRIEQLGTPDEIYRQPSSPFAARFVGDANVLPVEVVGHGGGRAAVTLAGQSLSVPCQPELPTGDAWLVLRPEVVRLGGPTAPACEAPSAISPSADPASATGSRSPGSRRRSRRRCRPRRAGRTSSEATSRWGSTRTRACCCRGPADSEPGGSVPLVYIEYISRLPGVSVEQFHFAAGLQDAWSEDYADDVLVLNIGRTFRTGPEPSYLAVWHTASAGIERIGDWEAVFASGEADRLEETFKLGARIDDAGCYEPLVEPVHRRGGLYVGEFLDFAPDATRDDVRSFYEERRAASGVELNLLCDRIGKLGPDPRALAVWNVGSWDRVDTLARELDGVDSPVSLVTAGLYRDLGQETL